MWLSLNDAIQRITECEKNLLPSLYDNDLSIYHTKFIVRRDATILNYYKNLILNDQKMTKICTKIGIDIE